MLNLKTLEQLYLDHANLEEIAYFSSQELNTNLVGCIRDALSVEHANYISKFVLQHLNHYMLYCETSHDAEALQSMEVLISDMYRDYNFIFDPDVKSIYRTLSISGLSPFLPSVNRDGLSEKAVIDNAKKAALRDGYDQFVLTDKDGNFSFCRSANGKPTVPIMNGEFIVGKVFHSRDVAGRADIRYHDYSRSPLCKFISTLEANREYTGSELHDMLIRWSAEHQYNLLSKSALIDAFISRNSIAFGLLQTTGEGKNQRFILSSEWKKFLTREKSSLSEQIQSASERNTVFSLNEKTKESEPTR